MKKLSLDVDQITVHSFVTDEYDDVRGTVHGAGVSLASAPRCCAGTVRFGPGGDDDCTSGCVCCRHRPAPKPKI